MLRQTARRASSGRLIVVAGATLALTVLAGGPVSVAQDDAEGFTFGGTFALTGPGAAYGSAMSRGVQLGVDALNAEGGVGGTPISTQFLDMKGEPKDAVLTAQRLIDEGVQIISTHLTAPPLAQCPVAEAAQVVLINGAGNSPELREACSYLLNNVMLIDDEQRVLFDWAVDNVGISKVGILRGLSYGEGALDSARAALEDLGVEVAGAESHPFGAQDLKPQLELLLAQEPDAIYLLNDASDELLAIRQLYDLGFRGPLLSTYNLLEEIAALPAEQTENLYAPGPPFTPDSALVEAYEAAYGGDVTFFTANFYNQTLILKAALERLQAEGVAPTGQAIRDAILAIGTFPSVTGGDIAFQADGTMVYPIDIFQVQDGTWASTASISLEDVQATVQG